MNILLAVCGSIAIGPNIISMLRGIVNVNKVVGIDINFINHQDQIMMILFHLF